VNATPAALSLSGITKRFGRLTALDDVAFVVRAGTVHALLGENGAGKSTLMRIAFGLLAPDAGQIAVNGVPVRLTSAAEAIARGIGMVHQHFTNVGAMTVAENIALGGRGLVRGHAVLDRLGEIARRTGLALDPDTRAEDLSVGGQQRLEIVKALTRDARILILDEPTAVLSPSEADELLAWLREFVGTGGTVVLITHKLREALGIADDVTVLRQGRIVTSGPAASTDAATLAAAMVGGRNGEDLPGARRDVVGPTAPGPPNRTIVRAAALTVANERGSPVLRDASFEILSGEIVGVAAVEGSGQHELLRALAGRTPPRAGSLDRPATVGFVPEDRHRDALVLDLSVAENVALRNPATRRGRVPWRSVRERTANLLRAFDVRGTPEMPARHVSGGNQQKLVLARELDGGPDLLVVDNPTRGLDIRATAAIHEHIRAAATRGAAIVVYSSDLDEVLSLATRIFVLHAGRLHETKVNRDAVARAMLGAA
jgi:simple sugar transport system ATP-binding protein